MKHTIKMMGPILSLTLIIAMLAPTITVFAQEENTVAFVHVNVIPMDGERILEGQTVVVEGDRITAMGPANEVTIPDGAQVIEADGQYLMPGLTDNHTHTDGMPIALALYLANGVTTVRSFNATLEDFEKKAAIENGEQLGPRLYLGPSVNGLTASLVSPVNQLNHAVAPYFVVDLGPSTVTGCEDARQFVLTAHEMGADFIKTNLGLPLESFDCIVATANELGIPVKGHVSDEVRAEHFINSGAEVQHATELYPFLSQEAIYDQPARHEDDLLLVDQNLPILIDMINANNMAFAPTLITAAWAFDQYEDLEGTLQRPEYRYYSPQVMRMLSNAETNIFYVVAGMGFADAAYRDKIRTFGLEFTQALFDGGVMLLAGSDSTFEGGPVFGFSLHDELQLFVDAGLTPYQALETATRNSAIAMGELDGWGTIEVGKRADLVLLNADPLDDIANTEQIAGVMVRGQWLTAGDLQHVLDDIVASYEVIELIPYADDNSGISGLVPSGWNELQPGVYARGNPEVDPTLLLQLAAPGKSAEDFALIVLADFGVTELPEPMDSYESATLAWELYRLESQMAPLALALAETEDAAYLVLLAAPDEEIDTLVETVFFPAVDAMTPTHGLVQEPVQCQDEYTVQRGDWLSKIAEKYYGDVLAYDLIAQANNARTDDAYPDIADSNLIEPGWTLCIPEPALEAGLNADLMEAVLSNEFSSARDQFSLRYPAGWITQEVVSGADFVMANSEAALERYRNGSAVESGDLVVNIGFLPFMLLQQPELKPLDIQLEAAPDVLLQSLLPMFRIGGNVVLGDAKLVALGDGREVGLLTVSDEGREGMILVFVAGDGVVAFVSAAGFPGELSEFQEIAYAIAAEVTFSGAQDALYAALLGG